MARLSKVRRAYQTLALALQAEYAVHGFASWNLVYEYARVKHKLSSSQSQALIELYYKYQFSDKHRIAVPIRSAK